MSNELDHVVGLCDRGAFSEASAYVQGLGVERPEDPVPVLLGALVHARQGDSEAAGELADRALNLTAPPGAESLTLASMIFRELGDGTQAALYGLRATTLNPHDWRAHAALARALATQSGYSHDAERAARRAIQLGPDEAVPRLALGEALLSYRPVRRRVREEGVAALVHAARLDSGNAVIQQALARARPDEDHSGCVGCLMFLVLAALLAGGRHLMEMAGNGIALVTRIDQDRPEGEDSLPGFLVVIAIAGVAWGLAALVRFKRRGKRPVQVIDRRRALAREMHRTDKERMRITATTVAAVFCMLPLLLTGSLAAPAADGTPSPTGLALLSLFGVVALSLLGWSAARWWLGPGQIRQALRVSGTLRTCLSITYLIVIVTALLSWAEVTGAALWTTLTVVHFAWFAAGMAPLVIGQRLRRRQA